MLETTKLNKLKDRALNVIPHQTGTFSRSANHFIEGNLPKTVWSMKIPPTKKRSIR